MTYSHPFEPDGSLARWCIGRYSKATELQTEGMREVRRVKQHANTKVFQQEIFEPDAAII